MLYDELEKKYPFFTPFEIKILYLISKNKIDYEKINSFKGKKGVSLYLKNNVKYNIKENVNENNNYDVVVNNLDINTLFLLKRYKLNLNKVYELLNKTKSVNIRISNQEKIYKKTKNSMVSGKVISLIIMILSIIAIIISVYNIGDWTKENKKINDTSTKINEMTNIKEVIPKKEDVVSDDYFKYLNVSMLDVDFNELLKTNKNTRGWLKVEGTNINYPFVQYTDNEYYLKHSFDNTSNKKGWVFLDYRNNLNTLDNNTILYAHGLVNNAMFGSLRKTIKPSWYQNKDNYIIKLSNQNSMMLWEVFSTYKIEPEDYYITTNFDDKESYNKFLNTIKTRSVYDYKVDLKETDKILTLSTCYDNQKRMVLHAKLIAFKKLK